MTPRHRDAWKKKGPFGIHLGRNEATGEVINAWLKSFDPDAGEGIGYVEWTDDRSEAKVFDTVQQVHEFWTQQSTVRPLRPDGKPNRPLTVYTVDVRPLESQSGVRWGELRKRGGA